MAFSKELAIIAQNSATAAATIVAALINAGDSSALDSYEDIRTDIFNGTIGLAGAESVVEVMEAKSSGGGRGGYYPKSGGASRPAGGGDPGSIEIRSGKHAGKTISAVYDADPEYIEWGAENMRNDFLRNKMSEFLAAA